MARKRCKDSSMEVDTLLLPERSTKRTRHVDKPPNEMPHNVNLDDHNTDPLEVIGITKGPPGTQNILALLENMSKNKELRNNKECMDSIANLLQQRFELSAKLHNNKSCDNT